MARRKSKTPEHRPADQVVDLCDEMLRLGREPGSGVPFIVTESRSSKRARRKGTATPDAEAAPAVGQHTPRSGPSDPTGRMGQAWDEQWNTLAAEFDRRAEDLADLVKALDPAYDVSLFYSPEPVSVWAAYPKARKAMTEDERKWHRDYELARGKTDAEADALLDSLDRMQEAQTCAMWTKMQWPGRVVDAAGHRGFLSGPALVHAFDRRFLSLRAWAAERARQAKAATGTEGNREHVTEGERTSGPSRRNVRAPTDRQVQIAVFYENGTLNQTEVAAYLTKHLPNQKKPISQSTVSRAIRTMNRWRAAQPDLGLPQIPTRKRRVASAIDPREIEKGARTDGRGHHQRERDRQRAKDKG